MLIFIILICKHVDDSFGSFFTVFIDDILLLQKVHKRCFYSNNIVNCQNTLLSVSTIFAHYIVIIFTSNTISWIWWELSRILRIVNILSVCDSIFNGIYNIYARILRIWNNIEDDSFLFKIDFIWMYKQEETGVYLQCILIIAFWYIIVYYNLGSAWFSIQPESYFAWFLPWSNFNHSTLYIRI